MSDDERKLLDTAGDYRYAVRDGTEVSASDWQSCRLVVTNKRLVLAANGSNQTLPHGRVTIPDDPEEFVSDVGETIPLRMGSNVIVASAADDPAFIQTYCRANVGGEVVLVRHPAVVGGVVQEESDWSKARFVIDDERFSLQFPDGETVACGLDDIGTVETESRTVMGEQRDVVEVEHTDSEDRSVETHLSGTARHTSVLRTLFDHLVEDRDGEYELTDTESQVLMALYSGVSPFEMADFVGISVEEVEAIYQKLLDVGAVDEVRTRTEVSLNAQGRNMASEAMNEQ
ncbi:CheF family chemotaxis protein [Halorhabdus sp. CUG00001]|uniref:CheF family chemotaxis protein n=1 Tax=Halorhabdus sp. CUG00001 TaxID=2600297 RepID=UPI00131C760C|nr:CheF family chemotaxis protein [Halorhabdus sp. CUG00001]